MKKDIHPDYHEITVVRTDGTSYTYSVRYNNGCGLNAETTGSAAADLYNVPGPPSITDITDDDVCAQSGVTITFTDGAGAASHDLWMDGAEVTTGITSPYSYDPLDNALHSYVVRAVNGTCFADSTPSDFTDADQTPTPTIAAK